eukprot:COSAG04_NODE_9971_length_816_cov_0.885635_3_plen_67_part_01
MPARVQMIYQGMSDKEVKRFIIGHLGYAREGMSGKSLSAAFGVRAKQCALLAPSPAVTSALHPVSRW